MTYFAKLAALLLVSCFALTGKAQADVTPGEVRKLYPLVVEARCTDKETGNQGRCYVFDAGEDTYMVFTQYGKPVFMRHSKDGEPYTQVWPTNDVGGQSL